MDGETVKERGQVDGHCPVVVIKICMERGIRKIYFLSKFMVVVAAARGRKTKKSGWSNEWCSI